jgi:hypothetical protein
MIATNSPENEKQFVLFYFLQVINFSFNYLCVFRALAVNWFFYVVSVVQVKYISGRFNNQGRKLKTNAVVLMNIIKNYTPLYYKTFPRGKIRLGINFLEISRPVFKMIYF